MLIYPNVKQAPIAGLSGFGGGTASQVFTGAGAAAGGFGGYDFVGVITKDGEKSVSSSGNVTVSHNTGHGSAFSYNGGSSLTGWQGTGTTVIYDVKNPVWASGAWTNKGSWTTIEKYSMGTGHTHANMNRGYMYVGGSKYFHRTRHDSRSGGCSGSYGTTYPYVKGTDGSYGNNSGTPFCSVGYEGWWVNIGSWDHVNETYYWARSDDNLTSGAIQSTNYPTTSHNDWTTYLGTGETGHIYFDSNTATYYADHYIIYGKVTDTLAKAQEYNMLSRTNHIDPYNA